MPLATEAPDALPLATSEPSPTEVILPPTQEVLPTDDVSPVPTQETLPTAAEESTSTQEAAPDLLPLAYSTNFDAGYPQELSASTGWTIVDLEASKALQPDTGAVAIHYASFFADSAVQARFFLIMGEGQVILRGYKAGLYASGLLTLYRGETLVTTVNIDMRGKTRPLVRLQIIGTQVQVSVDGTALITVADENLQAGQAGFAAREGSSLRVDDFAVYGLPVPAPAATSTSTATPEPTATSTRPAPMAGPTATCAPNNQISLMPGSDSAQFGSISPDGTIVVYNVAGKIYLFDRPNCTITELTDATAEPTDPTAYRLSTDNTTVFYKGTSLYRYNIAQGIQESIALDAAQTPQSVLQFDVTPDGRYVVYGTYAPMLTSDTNGLYDVYLRDLTTGVTEQISVDSAEQSLTPSALAGVTVGLSDNGRYVIFDSMLCCCTIPIRRITTVKRMASITIRMRTALICSCAIAG